MAPADALSQKDLIDTTNNNINAAIVPEPVVIQALDLTLTCHIKSSSSSDPLVLKAIQAVQKGFPLFPCSVLANWTFEDGHLYFKGRMYSIYYHWPTIL